MQEEKNERPEPAEKSKTTSGSQRQVLKMGKLLVLFPCCMIREPPDTAPLCLLLLYRFYLPKVCPISF